MKPAHEAITSNHYAKEVLREHDLRATRPREQILEVIGQIHSPFSAEDVFSNLKKSKSTLDLVTVYRTLAKFESIEILQRSNLGDGIIRYERKLKHQEHKHHFVCQKCRRVEDLPHCILQEQERYLKQMGFRQLSHRLEFFGLCPHCSPQLTSN